MGAQEADLAVCRATLQQGSASFAAAARLLPRLVRDDVTVVYAFCRELDDEVDRRVAHGSVERVRRRIDAVFGAARPERSVDRALREVVVRTGLPRAPFDAMLEGFLWDAAGRRYATLEALHGYGVRVAGTVGVLFAHLCGVRQTAVLARAVNLGVAMQLTNVARDVFEDARAGRVYLPLDWLASAGIDPDDLVRTPRVTQGLLAVVRRLLDEADGLYARAHAGIGRLPARARPGVLAARWIYADIGGRLRRAGQRLERRARTGRLRKLARLVQAWVAAPVLPWTSPMADSAEPLEAARPLLAAVERELRANIGGRT